RAGVRGLIMPLRFAALAVLASVVSTVATAQEVAPPAPPATVASPEPPKTTGPDAPIVVRDHRTIRSFPANLGHNMIEPWSKHSLWPLLIGGAATGLATP